MGSGKSSVGRELSTLLDLPFIDLDEQICRTDGRSIPEIFAEEGEEGFRCIESRVLKQVLEDASELVLSLGGGSILSEENSALVAQKCRCVYLRTPVGTIRRRLCGEEDSRPLLKASGVDALFAEREPLYGQTADVIIDTDGLAPGQIAREIISRLF